jgi:glutaredoxin/uncharacterized membrane protein
MNRRYLASLLFLIVAALGALYLLVEGVLQLFGTSICATEGCRVVAQYTRFGDLSMVLLGLGMLGLLAVLAFLGMRSESEGREKLIDLLLIVSLAGEGFFVGYQLFRLNALCIFCVSVFGLYVALGLLRVLAGHRDVIAGFLSLAAVLSLFYLILPAGGPALPFDSKHVLFYSPDCKHCAEIKQEIEAQKLEVRQVQVHAYASTLKGVGIEHVPTLLVNGPYEKRFLTGREAISRYLAGCRVEQVAPLRRPARTAPSPAPQQTGPLLLFPDPGTSSQLLSPAPDEGLCKDDVKCD